MNVAMGALLALSTLGAEPAAGKQVEQSFKDGKKALNYWLYLPKDYDGKKEFPLMLFLHGAGERGSDLNQVKKWGPPKLIEKGKDFPMMVVSPQCPKNVWWDVPTLLALLDKLETDLKVNKNRVYVTGLSMGGYGTWALGMAAPKRFAALVPICGGGDVKSVAKIKDVPIWVFHGDKDRAVPIQKSQELVAALKEAGSSVNLTVYKGVGHNSWSETYGNPKVFEWILEQERKSDSK